MPKGKKVKDLKCPNCGCKELFNSPPKNNLNTFMKKEKINKEMTEIWIATELLYLQQAIERIKDVFKEYIKLCQKKKKKN